jgi:3-oxosteroid 1-dehydrogenase
VARPPGWQFVALKLILNYWLDVGQRIKSKRDRRAVRGATLVGSLRRALLKMDVPLYLNTPLQEILVEDQRVTGIVVDGDGGTRPIKARRGVILACGGFEQNQSLRDTHLPVKTSAGWSLTPAGANTGDGLIVATAIGAATEFMDCMWWAPVILLPSDGTNTEIVHSMTNDQRHPYSIMVNRNGERFVNENCTYDEFGIAMISDQQKSGANVPCWLIFDTNYRKKYMCGGIMPSFVMPDWTIPSSWWDQYLYRAATIGELAKKIGTPVARLEATVNRFNSDAAKGVDSAFGRGRSAYDLYWGDPVVKPNPCLGPIEAPPFYAVRVHLGDLGSKGGLKANANAEVMSCQDQPIPGLYAVGNASGCATGNAYAGGGGTLGPALIFAFIAANHVAGCAQDKVSSSSRIP